MAPEQASKPTAAPPVPQAQATAASAIKPASKKTGLFVVAAIIGILLLGGIVVGGYFAIKALTGDDNFLKNLGKSDEQIANEALEAATLKMVSAMTTKSDSEEFDIASNALPLGLQSVVPSGSGSGIPSVEAIFTSDEEGLDSFKVNYDIGLESSGGTLSTVLSGSIATSEDNSEIFLGISGEIDFSGTVIPMQADLSARTVDGDGYMMLSNVSEEMVDTVADQLMTFFMGMSGFDPSDFNSEERAQYEAVVDSLAEGFMEAYTDQWIMSEGSDTEAPSSVEEDEALTDEQISELTTLYTETFGAENADYIGKEKLNKETVYQWKYKLTEEDLDELLYKSCLITSDDEADCEEETISMVMDLTELSIWINSSGEFRKVYIDTVLALGDLLDMADTGGLLSSDESLNLGVTLWLSDINDVDEITAPSEYITMEKAAEIFEGYVPDMF